MLGIEKVAFKDWKAAEVEEDLDEKVLEMRVARFSEGSRGSGGKMWGRNQVDVVGKVDAKNEKLDSSWGGNRAQPQLASNVLSCDWKKACLCRVMLFSSFICN